MSDELRVMLSASDAWPEPSPVDLLEVKLLLSASPEVLGSGDDMVSLALCKLDRVPGKNNWIERAGRLPRYIHEIACALHEKRGFSISRAIATALSRIKVWAAGGDNVNPDTVAKAAKALAEWEALRAKNAAKKAAK